MNNFQYCSPTNYIFGRGVEDQAGEQLAKLNLKHALIVYGQGSVIRSGLLDRVKASLDKAGIKYSLIGGVQPNPLDDKVYEGIDIARSQGCDCVLPVGGGSAIDTAKAIAAGALYDGDFWDFYCGKAIVTKALPIGVVLTIPAAGSEGSGNSVITKRDGMVKISIRTDMALRPLFALMNPELTFTLPPYQTASGIADMMAHIMERYFTTTPEVEVTDRLCEGILKAIIATAPRVIAVPDDYDARANIMWAGTLAHNGICGVGRTEDWSSHAIEHEISALYGVTHGAGLAVVFPAWMTYMTQHRPAKIAQFARRVFGVISHDDTTAALEGITALKSFYGTIGLPVTFTQLGVTNPDIDALVSRLHQHKGATIGAYKPLTAEDTAAIYRLML